MKKALVFGAGGFIGHHLVGRLKAEGFFVHGVDLHYPLFSKTKADEFTVADLRLPETAVAVMKGEIDELYQLAADMGGAGYLFTGEHDAQVMYNSMMINLHTLEACTRFNIKKVFFSSSACIYPRHNQQDPDNPQCEESTAYPANPDSEYGWEKLFAERLYQAYSRNYGFETKIARFHNVYGPESCWQGGKEKAPAALCRKIAQANDNDIVEIWGNGKQTRSFLYIDDCLDAIRVFMDCHHSGPVNIGSEEIISIDELAQLIARNVNKKIVLNYKDGPVGVKGRNSDNQLMKSITGWQPAISLQEGMSSTYKWVNEQLKESKKMQPA